MRKLYSVKTLSLTIFAILIMFVITCIVLTIRPLKSVHAETAIETSADSGEAETGDTGETTPSDTEETTPPDSSDTDKTLEEENKELKLKLEELIAEFNASSASEYFNKNILPLLTGSCSAIVAGLASLLPYIRNKNKRKQLEAYAATLQKANADLETLLKSTDPEAVKTAVDSLFGDRATEIANKMLEKMNIALVTYDLPFHGENISNEAIDQGLHPKINTSCSSILRKTDGQKTHEKILDITNY